MARIEEIASNPYLTDGEKQEALEREGRQFVIQRTHVRDGGTMQRCQWRGANTHRTKDQVSAGAMAAMQVAKFPAGFSAACECAASAGKVAPENCSFVCVYDPSANECAKFIGPRYRAQQAEDGGILIWSMPLPGVGAATAPTHDYRGSLRSHQDALTSLNNKNTQFWARDAEN